MLKPFILFIDQNETNHFPIRSIISQVVPEVRVEAYFDFQSFLNGLDHLTTSPSLFVLEISRPTRECQRLIQYLKADALWKKIPIVIFCDEADPGLLRECYDSGAASLIVKGNDWGKLSLALRTTLHYWLHLTHLPHLMSEVLPGLRKRI
ncbi:response regulator [Larkinella soli]|uniref:response regulator n=1 Tax=Larkinella soli TaxID=1770527 RepID=UPI000FFBE463|nr:response regulator [Larkinella soli]